LFAPLRDETFEKVYDARFVPFPGDSVDLPEGRGARDIHFGQETADDIQARKPKSMLPKKRTDALGDVAVACVQGGCLHACSLMDVGEFVRGSRHSIDSANTFSSD
jgi:hypothetical protein